MALSKFRIRLRCSTDILQITGNVPNAYHRSPAVTFSYSSYTDIGSSLFGRWWSSAFRLTTRIFVARGPALLFGISRWLSQHGINRKRRNNLTRVLIAVERSTEESKANSSHPSSREGHRCAGLGFYRSDSLAFVAQIVGAISVVQRNSVPSLHMRCIITASRRASATMAFFCPRRLAMFIAPRHRCQFRGCGTIASLRAARSR